MAPSKKNLKATKKFEKTHLKGVLERRKVTAKIKQKQRMKDGAKQRKAKDAEFYGKDGKPRPKGPKDRQVNDMSVDDFFKGGFEDIIDDEKAGKKRKRDDPKADAEDDDSDSDAVEAQPVASDSEGGSEDEDDAGMNQAAMDALAEKDPEFYKFLKENDPDALDFDDNADLAEVDELSAGEDSEAEEEQPKKKQKKGKKAEEEEEDEEAAEGESKELTTAAPETPCPETTVAPVTPVWTTSPCPETTKAPMPPASVVPPHTNNTWTKPPVVVNGGAQAQVGIFAAVAAIAALL
ncbi:hypothetical protein NLG97_g10329 [Lecanicillium saksenae]|uniref:Uncharacterized protein n=1 Tax=Lecanicillium saksenae TaxID=468837 RepID=A0ACC1QDQ1_9HYPO|nr:hypothetical protein NLG97_g10329 [Lecanicillium saksenae]